MKSAKKITAEPGVERAPSTINEVPRICLFDLDRNIGNQLISKGFNCTSASLGAQIQIPDRRVNPEDLYLKGNSDYPENLHEYQILVFDLSSDRQVLYDPSMHRSDNLKGDTIHALISRFPERLFDPRPLAAQALRERVCAFLEKESIIVVFSSPWESIEYKFAEIKCRTITKTEQKFPIIRFCQSALLLPTNREDY